jgi:hypothetical protein
MRFSANGVSVHGPLEEDAVIDAWPKVEAWISEALEREGFKSFPDDVLKDIADGVIGLYLIEDEAGEIIAAITCEVQDWPNANVFNIAHCGGRDLYRWAQLLGGLEAEAARLGCETMRITGRAGWGRIYPEYREIHRVFERKVMVSK